MNYLPKSNAAVTLGFMIAVFLSGCKQEPRFKLVSSHDSGIEFNNTITETDSFNVLTYEYIYNGAGVGIGDFNNDGLQDIFFAGNMVSSKLYLNQGDLTFLDVTKEAGLTTTSWCTGVSVADVNQDGFADIYISTASPDLKKTSSNLFFINKGLSAQGVPQFINVAAELNIAATNYSTQAVFFDFDRDRDLDMYLLTNALETFPRNATLGQRHDGTGKSVDRLFRNEWRERGELVFTDISAEAGIMSEGWGLGIVVNDFNNDNRPDIYCANDFLSSDHLYINNGNGTFSNQIGSYLKHQEFNGMGVDVADINNDGFNDLVALDMMPDDNLRQKTMFSGTGYDRFYKSLEMRYEPQFIRNVLQLNNGNHTFSDIAYLAGVHATDWSWSALFADFDNDGYRDLYITNGYRKDVTDLDFITYSKEAGMFGTDEKRLKNAIEAIEQLGGVHKPNFMFRNNGDLTFKNMSEEWGLAQPSYSNGAAYADLDNDGDLDIVTNNINSTAFLYKNKTIENNPKDGAHFFRIHLHGSEGNMNGIGTKISVYSGNQKWYAEHQVQRGYMSSVEPVEHFGIGGITNIDSVVITWPSGLQQTILSPSIDQTLKVAEADAKPYNSSNQKNQTLLVPVRRPSFKSSETNFVDFKQGQATLPHRHSSQGPAIAVGDINGDGKEDFIIGGTAGQPATAFVQKGNGEFKQYVQPTKQSEDAGLLLYDCDNDGDLDLYCVSGSSEFRLERRFYQDRLYKNDGAGNFQIDSLALPEIGTSGSCVIAADFDRDGDLDLFRGGRVEPTRYPYAPESYVLINDGKGNYKNMTTSFSPDLQRPGMVTTALAVDVNNDGWPDLAIAGEWMNIEIYLNERGAGMMKTTSTNRGWWNSLTAGDFDNDGDIDLIGGNLGLNTVFRATKKEPVSIYADDFDGNGSVDPIITRFIQGKEHPVHFRESMTEQIASLRRPLQKYSTFGTMTFSDIFPNEKLTSALIYRVSSFASMYFENDGTGKFTSKELPIRAQVSPIYGALVTDLNLDGNVDLIAIGNSYSTETLHGWHDAGIGSAMLGDGRGNFSIMAPSESDFLVDRDAKALARLRVDNHDLYIATQNNDSLLAFVNREPFKNATVFVPEALDTFVELWFNDGRRQRIELNYGSGYLSQSGRSFFMPEGVKSIIAHNSTKAPRTYKFRSGKLVQIMSE